jgi:Asp-tRNA(Asn)/Glu-tRNA(Gln) amidotransferase A subunit family amidase
VSQGGRHAHTLRRLRRRMDAVIAEERERQKPPPPPVSPEHAAMRTRIERAMGAVRKQVPEGMDLEGALARCDDQSDELANAGAEIVLLMRQEQTYLASQGVDSRPYARY